MKKVGIYLCTCLETRAVHIELVCDMTSFEFLLCLSELFHKEPRPINSLVMMPNNFVQLVLFLNMSGIKFTEEVIYLDMCPVPVNSGELMYNSLLGWEGSTKDSLVW